MRWKWRKRSQGLTPLSEERPVSAREVVTQERAYSRSMLSLTLASLVAGGILAVGLTLLTELSTGATMSGPRVTSSPVTPASGAGALAVLLPVAIALQVLLRLQQDPSPETWAARAAQRQFWGQVAMLVSVSSAFVGIAVALRGFLEGIRQNELDLAGMVGLPAGTAIAMMLAGDAAVIALDEGRRLSLAARRRVVLRAELRTARMRIQGDTPRRPTFRLVAKAAVLYVAFGGLGVALVQGILHNHAATFGWSVGALLMTLYAVAGAPIIARAVLLGQVFSAVSLVTALGFILVYIALLLMTTGWKFIGGDDLHRYQHGLLYGASASGVAFFSVVFLLRGPRRKTWTSPIGAVTKASFTRSIARLEEESIQSEKRAAWRAFAAAAIVLSVLPFAAFALAWLASVQIDKREDERRGLLIAAWAIPTTVFLAEAALLWWWPMWAR